MNIISITNRILVLTLYIKCLLIQGEAFHVSDFGAYSNDDIDDSKSIQLTINTAISSGLNSTAVFGYGTYNLSSTVYVYITQLI